MGICGSKDSRQKVISHNFSASQTKEEVGTNRDTKNKEATYVDAVNDVTTKTTIPPPKRAYKKGDLIDSGAYGKVYKGFDLNTGQLLAIKTIKITGDETEVRNAILMLKSEIGLMKKLKHKNIVQYKFTEIQEDTKEVDIGLEYVSGGSLRQLLNRVNRFHENTVRIYTQQILEGLNYLHENGVIHRDIKCANILIEPSGTIKLTDFGTSKRVQNQDILDVSKNNSIKGSPYWMSPEVVNREQNTFKLDIWSLGGCVIEMLTGKPPYAEEYDKNTKEVLRAISQKQIPLFPKSILPSTFQFLTDIFIVNPENRPTAAQLLSHPYFSSNLGQQQIEQQNQEERKQKLNQSRERQHSANQLIVVQNHNKAPQKTKAPIPNEQDPNLVNRPQNIIKNNQTPKIVDPNDIPVQSAYAQIQKIEWEKSQQQKQLQEQQKRQEWEQALQMALKTKN